MPVGFEAYAWLPNPAWKTVTADVEGAVLLDSYGASPFRLNFQASS